MRMHFLRPVFGLALLAAAASITISGPALAQNTMGDPTQLHIVGGRSAVTDSAQANEHRCVIFATRQVGLPASLPSNQMDNIATLMCNGTGSTCSKITRGAQPADCAPAYMHLGGNITPPCFKFVVNCGSSVDDLHGN